MLATVATALGITVAQAAALLLGLLIIVAYQALAITGQIILGRLSGEFARGLCLHHPLLAFGVLGPVAVNIPVIVSNR